MSGHSIAFRMCDLEGLESGERAVFDIHKPFYDPDDGELDWDRLGQLYDVYLEYPEGKQVREEWGAWELLMFEYGFGHVGVDLPTMTRRDMEEVLFELFPRKVSTEPESAQEIIGELRAFWQYL